MIMRTPAYYFEKYIGKIVAIVFAFVVLKFWDTFSIITEKDIFDKLITVSATLFGFLLTVLTLIIQSTSESIQSMKRHGSYKRLIRVNKSIVLLFAFISLISIAFFIKSQALQKASHSVLKYPSVVVISLFICAIVETFIFTLIFYKILLSEKSQ